MNSVKWIVLILSLTVCQEARYADFAFWEIMYSVCLSTSSKKSMRVMHFVKEVFCLSIFN